MGALEAEGLVKRAAVGHNFEANSIQKYEYTYIVNLIANN
jgi:hypothetical protein